MNHPLVIPFRFLGTLQRTLLLTFLAGGGFWLMGELFQWRGIFNSGRLGVMAAAAGFVALAGLEILFSRRKFEVSCPICNAPARPAAWTFVLQCYCRRCHQVYATGLLWLRFFAPRRVEAGPSKQE